MAISFLSQSEIAELTGATHRSVQRRALRKRGLRFFTRPDGTILLLRDLPKQPSVGETLEGLISHDEIVQRAKPAKKICAIYFLVSGSSVVYVGQTINLSKRIGEHIADDGKYFDSFHYVAAPKCDLSRLERAYINLFKPKLNLR